MKARPSVALVHESRQKLVSVLGASPDSGSATGDPADVQGHVAQPRWWDDPSAVPFAGVTLLITDNRMFDRPRAGLELLERLPLAGALWTGGEVEAGPELCRRLVPGAHGYGLDETEVRELLRRFRRLAAAGTLDASMPAEAVVSVLAEPRERAAEAARCLLSRLAAAAVLFPELLAGGPAPSSAAAASMERMSLERALFDAARLLDRPSPSPGLEKAVAALVPSAETLDDLLRGEPDEERAARADWAESLRDAVPGGPTGSVELWRFVHRAVVARVGLILDELGDGPPSGQEPGE